MRRFVQGEGRTQVTLLPELRDDYVTENNPARVVDVFSINQISASPVLMMLNQRPQAALPIIRLPLVKFRLQAA